MVGSERLGKLSVGDPEERTAPLAPTTSDEAMADDTTSVFLYDKSSLFYDSLINFPLSLWTCEKPRCVAS
jgi:hypothetical protein